MSVKILRSTWSRPRLGHGRPSPTSSRARCGAASPRPAAETTIGRRRFLAEVVEIKGLLAGPSARVRERPVDVHRRRADGMHVVPGRPAAAIPRLIGPGDAARVSVATPEKPARRLPPEPTTFVSPVFLTSTKPDAEHAVGLEAWHSSGASSQLAAARDRRYRRPQRRAVTVRVGRGGGGKRLMTAPDPESAAVPSARVDAGLCQRSRHEADRTRSPSSPDHTRLPAGTPRVIRGIVTTRR